MKTHYTFKLIYKCELIDDEDNLIRKFEELLLITAIDAFQGQILGQEKIQQILKRYQDEYSLYTPEKANFKLKDIDCLHTTLIPTEEIDMKSNYATKADLKRMKKEDEKMDKKSFEPKKKGKAKGKKK